MKKIKDGDYIETPFAKGTYYVNLNFYKLLLV